jgi:hypothetical protein
VRRVSRVDDVRALALVLPRTTEKLVRDRVTFRVGPIVYAGFSQDETIMGFGFPKEEREALVAGDDRYLLPSRGDLRWNWVLCRPDLLADDELAERVVDAWRMVVPKRVAAAWDAAESP